MQPIDPVTNYECNYNPDAPILFVYYERKLKKNLGITYHNPRGVYTSLVTSKVPQPVIVGLN
jgi:hypothetical protein